MKTRGFTLIELLIVVAIIAILAAIAVPNFLEAQVRAKVSRVKNDQRTIATALESYHIDNRCYPPYGPYPPPATGQAQVLNPRYVTTPIAYLSSGSLLEDPFRAWVEEVAYYSRYYQYCNFDDFRYKGTTSENWVMKLYGYWRVTSAGPDRYFWNTGFEGDALPLWGLRIYDPTNGTVSIGDIFRTHLEGAEVLRLVEVQY